MLLKLYEEVMSYNCDTTKLDNLYAHYSFVAAGQVAYYLTHLLCDPTDIAVSGRQPCLMMYQEGGENGHPTIVINWKMTELRQMDGVSYKISRSQ